MNRSLLSAVTGLILLTTPLTYAEAPDPAASPAPGKAEHGMEEHPTVDVDLMDSIRPTQVSIGRANVQEMYQRDLKEAHGKDIVQFIYEKMKQNPPPAIIGPDNKYYITDAHHRTTEMYLAWKNNSAAEPPSKERYCATICVPVEVKASFNTLEEFYQYLADHRKGYFPSGWFTRIKTRSESSQYRLLFKLLPKNIEELSENDSPLRSVVGRLMFEVSVAVKATVTTPPLADYIEFLLGEQIRCKVDVFREMPEPGHWMNEAAVPRAARAIFGDGKKESGLVNFLKHHYQKGMKRQAWRLIDQMAEASHRLYPSEGAPPAWWSKCDQEDRLHYDDQSDVRLPAPAKH